MLAAHLVLPEAAWLVNLLASAAIGTVVYGVVVLAIGLPAVERAKVFTMLRRFTGRGAAAGGSA